MSRLLLSTALALTIAGGAGHALAQDKVDGQPTQGIKKQDTVPPATGRNLSEQAGTTEPSSKVQGTSKDESVFVNGVLTAPGAPADVDTAPAKFSARTDADDQVPIAGYRLKHLTGDQRGEIVQGLGSEPDKASRSAEANAAYAIVGAEIPSTVAREGLTAMPDVLTAKFPGLKGTAFMRAGSKVLVIDLDNSLVIGVLDA